MPDYVSTVGWSRKYLIQAGYIHNDEQWEEFVKYMNDTAQRFFEEKE